MDTVTPFTVTKNTDFKRPPWEAIVLKTTTTNILLVVMHHSLYDGESIYLMFNDLAAMYQGLDSRPRPPFRYCCKSHCKDHGGR